MPADCVPEACNPTPNPKPPFMASLDMRLTFSSAFVKEDSVREVEMDTSALMASLEVDGEGMKFGKSSHRPNAAMH